MVRLCAHHVCDDCNGVCICWGPASCSTSFFIAWRYHHFHPSGLLAFVFVSNISYIDTQPKVDSVWQKSKVLYINVSDFKHVSSLTYCLCFYYKVSYYICKSPKNVYFFLKCTMNKCIHNSGNCRCTMINNWMSRRNQPNQSNYPSFIPPKSKCPRKNSLILACSLNFLF